MNETVVPHLGWTAAIAIFGVLTFIIGIWLVLCLLYAEERIFALIPALALAVDLIAASAALWPLDQKYHEYTLTTGTVSEIQSRQYGDSNGGTTQYYGIKFTDGRIRKCVDMRCNLLKPGDQVQLWCSLEYQFGPADPGWICDWKSSPRVPEM